MARRSFVNSKPCTVPGCDREQVGRGWCDGHYSRWRTKGDLLVDVPLKSYDKNRDFYISKEGYRYIKAPDHPNANQNGWVLEHRKIMSDNLSRPLTDVETVHHKNGVRVDNRVENLELRNGQHGAGQTVEDKVEYAIQILSEYAPMLLNDQGINPDLAKAQALISVEMNRLRGRLAGLFESFGLPEKQERGAINTLKSLSYDAQKAITEALKD